jgi:tetratricopeptide (TPR) repeat protein
MPVMDPFASTLLLFLALTAPAAAQNDHANEQPSAERFGTVEFVNSCSSLQQVSFNSAVAVLHDFWYEEAQRRFEQIAKDDPTCAMAHWGIAMSQYHQIWNRPNDHAMDRGRSELEKAKSIKPQTDREREYIAALWTFYQPGKQDYQARVDAYSAAMSVLYKHYPDDVDAGAFYGLSLLADEPPSDTSLAHQRQALAVLNPLFAKNPEHPGLAHYIIHACDNPSLARQGLEAARRYGEIAPGAAHSAHMPSHIFARLGMWQEDINANLASVAASQRAVENHQSSGFDQLHADDFLLYAYLQTAQDALAKGILNTTSSLLAHMESMPNMAGMDMSMMLPGYRTKFSVFYDLEMRDWSSAAALQPVAAAPPEVETLTYWARIVGDGHLHRAEAARADLTKYADLLEQIKKGKYADFLESTGAQVEHGQVLAWAAFAAGDNEKALSKMRAVADLQDKVGQAEVDIPAREMLADMLLELRRPEQALTEYETALQMSPNRFNGLYNAGAAAEAAGNKESATKYYSALMKVTDNGTHSDRVEFARVRTFLSSAQAMLR